MNNLQLEQKLVHRVLCYLISYSILHNNFYNGVDIIPKISVSGFIIIPNIIHSAHVYFFFKLQVGEIYMTAKY